MTSDLFVCKLVSVIFLAAEGEAKVDSGLEMQSSQDIEEMEFPGDKFYDKAKCFFDNISSDLKPR